MDITALFNAGIAFGATGTTLALALRYLHKPAADNDRLIEQIDALLPQTQCGQCGYAGCRPYAQAIADGEAINRCPPGGDATIDTLAQLLNAATLPLDGEAKPKAVAFIREAECIGCTKCIQACPVDAIVGAAKYMHTVIADECTGCDLCVEPCPVDCIEMRPLPAAAPRAPEQPALACIRCGLCAPECPVSLLPQQLYYFARRNDREQLSSHALDTCIECRACEVVCPSHIPLVDYFQQAKAELKQAQTQQQTAVRYKARFEAFQLRQQRDAAEREQRRAARLIPAVAVTITEETPEQQSPAPLSKQDEIRAAIARAKAKKIAQQTPPRQH